MNRFSPLPPDIHLAQTGLDTLLAMIAGQLPGPPIAETLNFTPQKPNSVAWSSRVIHKRMR